MKQVNCVNSIANPHIVLRRYQVSTCTRLIVGMSRIVLVEGVVSRSKSLAGNDHTRRPLPVD
jgi:hypothetical protein